MIDSPKLLTAEQTCKALCISRKTLYSLTKSGRLKSVIIGPHCLRWDTKDIDRFIDGCKNSNPVKIGDVIPDVLNKLTIESPTR
jgi:predicted DNA-binding transcriptional regulator AlpA